MRNTKYMSLILASLFLFACASQTPEERAEGYLDKGDAKMEKAIGELQDAENEYLDYDSKGAVKAFNKALGYIDDAIVYYAKADTTPDQKAAVASLQSGLDEMEKCVKALEKDDDDTAEKHYTTAQGYFDSAADSLWSTS